MLRKNPTCLDRYEPNILCVGGILTLIILFVNKMLMNFDLDDSNSGSKIWGCV